MCCYSFAIILVLLVLIQLLTCHCPLRWTKNESLCYLFSSEKVIWSEANEKCKSVSSKLAEPRNDSALQFLTGHTQKLHDTFWLGISDIILEDWWIYTSDLSKITLTNWGPSQPDQHIGANCVCTYNRFNSLWADEPCSLKYRYVCERSAGAQEQPFG